ncbi:hypothetical protein F5888DRAFT_1635321 [Russula emetica]|nr:hypothetical protein F5888DRAFT_1635321 [Russula emetica]
MQYKVVAWILLILSVFSVVLAAPVPVREACDNAAEGGENVIIVSGKRAARGNSYEDSDSDSDTEFWKSPYTSPSSYHYVDGSNTGVDTPSSSLSGSGPPPRSGETEVPLDPEGAFNPGTTTGNQPASFSNPKKVHWGPTTKVHFYDDNLPLPPGREGYLAKVAAQQNSFGNKFKTFFSKLGKLNFRPRFQPAVDTGALTVRNLG